MTSERWLQIEELYHAVLERAADQRATFLADACAGDHELQRNVEALLKANNRAGGFLAAPALELAAKATAEQLASLVGQQVSHYKVLSLLGTGGMGEVYLARDQRLDHTVAL